MKKIKFYILEDPEQPNRPCRPVEIIDSLIDTKPFSVVIEAMTYKPLPGEETGNCHEVATALMSVLIMTRQSKGWVWVKGVKPQGKKDGSDWPHSWLEHDGWAIDASNNHAAIAEAEGGGLPILIYDASYYRKLYKLKVTSQRNSKQTWKWISRRSRK